MSDRLISADKLLTKYQDLCEGLACINCPFYGLDNRCGLESMILKEQIVDAVEVVRCKDCKWFRVEDWGEMWCGHTNGLTICRESYCSDGERKEDASDV